MECDVRLCVRFVSIFIFFLFFFLPIFPGTAVVVVVSSDRVTQIVTTSGLLRRNDTFYIGGFDTNANAFSGTTAVLRVGNENANESSACGQSRK